ncbi:hypothetical protein EB1_09070 [Empedobacter brevis NBRC 14943 = ATCC 43319]|uniref:DUF5723 domain-containing protein n=1 Tax=Empedobacter brevis NBRC 14943 = ATCC 43319 TaxID=1218108 RepID=A0A511NES8_9FLAO|nr:DUF5723 family protein [Empedobacter brevis]GEM51117.1 hypothetical protein EB1_09070 [Empedobacter brevis NBRC 14943 = ATCC 43319]
MKKYLYIPLFCSALSFGQNILSFSNDQYIGINGSIFSPATPYFNPNKWDVNIISEDALFTNDYAYISDQNVLGLLKGKTKTANPKTGISGKTHSNILDFNTKHFVSYHVENDLLGPAVSFKKKINNRTYRVGVFTRLRTQGSVQDLDNYFRFSNKNEIEPSNYTFNPAKTNAMNWVELGLNLSTNLYTTPTEEFIVGANLKYLIGLDGAYINNKKTIKLEAIPTLTSTVSNPDADIYASGFDIEAGYSTNYDFDRDKYVLRNRGNGIGIDLGMAFVKRRTNDELYDFKFSANLLDIGFVNFRGENHHFYNPLQKVQIRNNPDFDQQDFESIGQYLKLLSNEVYGDSLTSHQSNKFTIGLPTSLHLNMSQKIVENQYLNFNWIQRIPVFENSLKRTNVLQTSYTIQKDGFGIGPSLSLYDYEKVTFGGYIRIGPLILGSDNALPLFFKQKKLTSANFYFGLKLYPFWDNEAKRRSKEECDCE